MAVADADADAVVVVVGQTVAAVTSRQQTLAAAAVAD